MPPGKVKIDVNTMFDDVNLFLTDGSNFDALMKHIENGDYDAFINATKELQLVKQYRIDKEDESRSRSATILDVLLSRLMKFDRFSRVIGLYFSKRKDLPVPEYTDFFDEHTTSQLTAIIDALLKHGANSAESHSPSYLIENIASTYGFIKEIVSSPENPEFKQKFSEYLNFMQSVARSLYEINKKSFPDKSFEEIFNKEADSSYVPWHLKKQIEEKLTADKKRRAHAAAESKRLRVDGMFGAVEQCLRDGSNFDELMHHIENGIYDPIINAEKKLKLVKNNDPAREDRLNEATIFDMVLSRLMKFDRFSDEIGLYFSERKDLPLPEYTDFFNESTTPQYIAIIDALLKHGAKSARFSPSRLIDSIASTYGFIEKVVSPPQNPELKQKFSEYLNSMLSVARSLYERNKELFTNKSFEEMFKKEVDGSYVPWHLKKQIEEKLTADKKRRAHAAAESKRLRVDGMFGAVEQCLRDGSNFDELMHHIENGIYDPIINAEKELKLVKNNDPAREDQLNEATILDMVVSRLMKFDRFGNALGHYFANRKNLPLPEYTDFFDESRTPQYIAIINTLLKHGAKSARFSPSHLIEEIASTYGFIKKVVSPPQNPELKQKFSEYLNSMQSVARSLYEINKKSFPDKSFEEIFNKEADSSYIPWHLEKQIEARLKHKRTVGLEHIIEQMKSGNYADVLAIINSGAIDNIINEPIFPGYFFAESYSFLEDKGLTLLERLLQLLLKTKTLQSPMDLKTKKWSDIFDPKVDPKWLSVIEALAKRTTLEDPSTLLMHLVVYINFAEAFIKPPSDNPGIAQQYKQYLQAIKKLAEDIFNKYKIASSGVYKNFEDYVQHYKWKYDIPSDDQGGKKKESSGNRGDKKKESSGNQGSWRNRKKVYSREEKDDALKFLGLSLTATPAEIKKRHRDLVRELHPDALKQKGKSPAEKKVAENKLKDINAAYDVLNQ